MMKSKGSSTKRAEGNGVDSDPESKRCKFCATPIDQNAIVCKHCSRPLTLGRFFHLEIASLLSLAIATGLLILVVAQVALGYFQFEEAQADRVDAAEALEQSEAAREAANEALRQAQLAEKIIQNQKLISSGVNEGFANFFSDICNAFDGNFYLQAFECRLKDGKIIRYQPMIKGVEGEN